MTFVDVLLFGLSVWLILWVLVLLKCWYTITHAHEFHRAYARNLAWAELAIWMLAVGGAVVGAITLVEGW